MKTVMEQMSTQGQALGGGPVESILPDSDPHESTDPLGLITWGRQSSRRWTWVLSGS